MKVMSGAAAHRVDTVYDAFYDDYDPNVSGPECSGGIVAAGGDGTLVFREFPYDEWNARPKPLARVIGWTASPIPGAIPQGNVAVAAGRVLILVDEQPPWLELRNARTGARIARVPQMDATAEIGLSSSFAAVLARSGAGMRISLYDAADGSTAGDVAVSADATDLSASGTRVAFVSDQTIWVLNAKTKQKSPVVTAKGIPFGVSLAGGSIVWAENARGRGRILAIELPR
jgi:hypothetical protein